MAKIFGFNISRANAQSVTQQTPKYDSQIVHRVEFARPELPQIKEVKNKDWVEFGTDNLYPEKLLEYLNTSAIHNAIVMSKSKIVAGNDILFDGIKINDYLLTNNNPKVKAFYDNPTSNPYENLNDLVYKLSFDFQIFGAFALEVIWSTDFTTIAKINHIDVSKIRCGKLEDGEVKNYYYSKDWANWKKCGVNKIATFNPEDKENYNQLIYVRNWRSGMDYYGMPDYISALAYISIDSQMGQFHLANINNGFSPSMTVKFFKVPGSPEEADTIVRSIKNQFSGTKNSGKAMVFFSDGKELAPEITPINVTGLDKQYMQMADQVVQQIIAAHRVTTPMILGIAVPGKLGYSNELETSYKAFDKYVITPEQHILERVLNKIGNINQFGTVMSIEKLNPFA